MATKKKGSSSGIGSSLILIIFIVLTLTVFSVLTLSSSKNELNRIEKSVKMSAIYYGAEKTAAEKCGKIKEILNSNSQLAEKITLLSDEGAESELSENGGTVSFTTEIDDKRLLKTVLELNQGDLTIVSQTIHSKNSSAVDDGFEIWDGLSPLPIL